MSQDHDPLDETLRFQPIDPYNIGPDTAGAPLPDVEADPGPEAARRPSGLKQRVGRLGAPKLAALGAGLVIVVGGVAWGTSALTSSKHPSNTQAQGQLPEDAAPAVGGTGKQPKTAKAARIKITKLGAGSFTGTEGGRARTVTVVYGDDTRFGTKARPLSVDQLQVGMIVTVAGTRAGDEITALLIAAPKKTDDPTGQPASPSSSPSSSSSSSAGSTLSG